MPGPFDFITDLFGGGSGNQDQGAPPSDAGNPFSNMPLPQRGAAASGTIFGSIDHLMGVPTNESLQAGNTERVRQSDLRRTESERMAEGEINARAAEIRTENPGIDNAGLVRRITQDPVWSRNILNVKDPNKTLSGIRDLTAPTPPIQVHTPQGGRTDMFDANNPTGDATRSITQPSNEAQEIDRIMAMSPEELERYKIAKRATQRARQPNMREEALEELEQRGVIDRVTRLKIEGGTLAMTPIMDPLRPGIIIGHKITDLTQAGAPERIIPVPGGQPVVTPPADPNAPAATTPPADPRQTPVTPPQPGVTEQQRTPPPRQTERVPGAPEAPAATTEAPFDPANPSPNTADMFDAIGPVGLATTLAGRVTGNIDPRYGAQRTQAQQGQLATLQTQLQLLRTNGRQFARDQQMLSSLTPGPNEFFNNPTTAAIRTYSLQGFLQAEAEAARREFQNPLMSTKTRQEAAERLQALEGVLRAMPERGALRAKIASLYAGGGGTTVGDLLNTLPGVSDIRAMIEQPARQAAPRVPGSGRNTLTQEDTAAPHSNPNPPPVMQFPPDLTKVDDTTLARLWGQGLTPQQKAAIQVEAKRRRGVK